MRTFDLPEVTEGEFLGDYQVLGVLGRGPMGTTYHVLSNVLQKEFAIKTLRIDDSLSLPWLDRLEAQAALIGRLSHRHIDQVISSGRTGELWFCVKDFIHDGEGSSCHLGTYRDRFGGKVSHFQAAHIAHQLIKALDHAASYVDAHNRGVFHGNLKPENILMAYCRRPDSHTMHEPFEIKVSDFQPYGLFNPFVLTRLYKQWIGTLHRYPAVAKEKAIPQVLRTMYHGFDYRSPELQSGGKPTAFADQFSFGVLMYELLTGVLPSGLFPEPSTLRHDIPPAWDDLIMPCLEQRADCRFQGYEDMLRLIEERLLIGEEFTAPNIQETVKDEEEEKPRERLSLTPPGMVYIPAGTFFVGSADCGQDALPQHEVENGGFYMDRTPVTNAQFAEFVAATGYKTEAEEGKGAPIWIDGEWRLIPGIHWRTPTGQKLPDEFDEHPVAQVSYVDAVAYCEWLGRRLPTEQEWEQAARGGLANVHFPWGDTISKAQANYSSESTTPVMSYQANGYGLYDMVGNVWEWTSSWYQAYPGNHQPSSHYGEKYRVVRGGAWMYDGAHCMVSYRNANDPTHSYPTVGFRTVVDFKCDIPV